MPNQDSLKEAIKFANEVHPLPRCKHDNALKDHADEILEPPCGSRWSLPTQEQAKCPGCVAAHLGYTNQNDLHTCDQSGRVSVSPEPVDAQVDGMEHEGGTSQTSGYPLRPTQEQATTNELIETMEQISQRYAPKAILDALSVAFNRLDDPNAEMLHRTLQNGIAAYVTPKERL